MSKEEVLYNPLRFIEQIAYAYFVNTGMATQKERLFQYQFSKQLWSNIRNFCAQLGCASALGKPRAIRNGVWWQSE